MVYEQLIEEVCLSSLMDEVSLSPKPGLVDKFDSGAHCDMNYQTFLLSIASLKGYFSLISKQGMSAKELTPSLLQRLRPIGQEYENQMLKATGGVNTHKGAIFSLGILAAAAGFCYNKGINPSAEEICRCSAIIAMECETDFSLPPSSHGEILYHAQGFRGVRGEVCSGFLSVRRYALPVLRSSPACDNTNLNTLMNLITHVYDTNILYRSGQDGLCFAQQSARQFLELGGAFVAGSRQSLDQMNSDFKKRNISPGGSADLLSVALVLHRLEEAS